MHRAFALFILLMGLQAGAALAQSLDVLRSMSPEQLRALAAQQGISLGSDVSQSEIAQPGAQIQQRKELRDQGRRFGEAIFDREVSTFAPTDDAPVPANYVLGPGDELTVSLFGARNQQFTLSLSRDGTLNFPELGPIRLAGLTFERARQLIQTRVKQQLVGVDAVISMGSLRAINVFMAGEVKAPGAYSVSALTTITQALYASGGPTEIGSLRDIQVKRNGRVVKRFDLYELLALGDASNDMRLQSGDVLFVPLAGREVEIGGAVFRPGTYEVKDGESLNDILGLSGGLRDEADTGNIILSRYSKDEETNQVIDLAAVDISKLEPSDILYAPFAPQYFDVKQRALKAQDTNRAFAVQISGEVQFPGTYYVRPGERLSDLIARSGGYTQEASLNGAIFTREAVRVQERARARELAELVKQAVVGSYLTDEVNQIGQGSLNFITGELENYEGLGRLVVDLPRALAGDQVADIELNEGDELILPKRSNSVFVYGEVRRPSSHKFESSRDLQDYLALAAGLSARADKKSIYLLKANGSVTASKAGWFSARKIANIEPGDTIIVPVNTQYRASLPFWRDVVSIVYQGAVAVAAIQGLNN
jgi:polysaccharide export outer membrane protein